MLVRYKCIPKYSLHLFADQHVHLNIFLLYQAVSNDSTVIRIFDSSLVWCRPTTIKKLEQNTYPLFIVVYIFSPIPPYVEIMHGFQPHPWIHHSHTSANSIKLRNFTVCDSWDDNSKMNFTTEIQKYVHLFPCTTLLPTREKRWYICVLLNHIYKQHWQIPTHMKFINLSRWIDWFVYLLITLSSLN